MELSEIKDSMLYDSIVEIADISNDNYLVSLQVQGEKRIIYKGNTYMYIQDFPKELIDMIIDGTVWDNNDDVFIDMNNWFEFMYADKTVSKNGEEIWQFYDGDVYEGDMPITDEELFETMLEHLRYITENNS